jgi:hypothetical protein
MKKCSPLLTINNENKIHVEIPSQPCQNGNGQENNKKTNNNNKILVRENESNQAPVTHS